MPLISRRKPRLLVLFLGVLLGLGFACTEPAQSQDAVSPPAANPEMEQRIRELENIVRQLQKAQVQPAPAQAAPGAESTAPEEAPLPPPGLLLPTSSEEPVEPGESSAEALAPPAEGKPPAGAPAPTGFQALIKRVEVLEKDRAKATAAAAAKKTADEGWIDMSKDKWTIKLGGHVQMDYINWPDADSKIVGATNYFSYRRLRLVADGEGYGVFDFRLQMTLEPGSGANTTNLASPDVKDAYFTANYIPFIGRFRIGNFFVPFGLEQVTNDTNNIFLERSIPTQTVFCADREPGVAIYNHSPDYNLSWSTGVFFDSISDTIKTRLDMDQGWRWSGRVVYLPYYDEPSEGRYLVHTGLGVLHTRDNDNIVLFQTPPQLQRAPVIISTGNLNARATTTANAELAVVWGPVTVQSEAYLCSIDFTRQAAVDVSGAYVHVSYFVTGEHRQYERFGQHGAQFGRNRPFSNFFLTPGGCGWGALELKGRWSHLDLDRINRGMYNDFTFGFNWYWSDRTRIMFDWIHPMTTRGTLPFGQTASDVIGMRFDWNW